MKTLLKLAGLATAIIALALVITRILGIPIPIFGRPVDPSLFLTVISSLVAALLYWFNQGSPHRLAAAYLKFLNEHEINAEQPSDDLVDV